MTPLTASRAAYRRNTVLSASPEQLVVMLYDGAARFLRQAAATMAAGEVERTHHTLRRAEQIVAHLDTVLDYERGGQISPRLHAIYRFCLAHINRARFDQDPHKLEQVIDLLGELRSSWAAIANG